MNKGGDPCVKCRSDTFISKLYLFMVRIAVVLLYLISTQTFAQRNLKVEVQDFNNDGVIDTLESFYSGGSGFGGTNVKLINGKSREIFELSTYSCFCSITQTVAIPSTLAKPENSAFLEAVRSVIVPNLLDEPDPSLEWIIEGAYSNKVLDNNKYFDKIIDPQLEWNSGKFRAPSSYAIETRGDTLTLLQGSNGKEGEFKAEKNAKGFIIYYGHNHYRNSKGDSLILVVQSKPYQVFKTSHGVFVKKDEVYKWLFIGDVNLTSAPDKLRWESIDKVKLVDKYVIVQQSLRPGYIYAIYVINIETGICGRLKFDNKEEVGNGKEKSSFAIDGESILLNVGGIEIAYPINDIFLELENLYIAEK